MRSVVWVCSSVLTVSPLWLQRTVSVLVLVIHCNRLGPPLLLTARLGECVLVFIAFIGDALCGGDVELVTRISGYSAR